MIHILIVLVVEDIGKPRASGDDPRVMFVADVPGL